MGELPKKQCFIFYFPYCFPVCQRTFLFILASLSGEVYPPIITVGHPATIVPPCAVLSPMRAAGLPPIITVDEPFTIVSGGPTQTHMSPTTAAGIFPISTFGTLGPTTGPPTWGIGEGNAGVCMGQVCISVILAAGGIISFTI